MKEIDKAWTKEKKEIIESLDVNPEEGLKQEKVDSRLSTYGLNNLKKEQEVSFFKVLVHEIFEPMILLLFAVGILYTIFGILTPYGEWFDGIVIFIIITILVFVEIYNEYRAKKTIASLQKMATPETTVLREGVYKEIDPKKVVPGDIIYLKVGERVPADMRLLESYGLQSNESVLTGESIPISKDANIVLETDTELMERKNMVFAGSTITKGKGTGVIVNTGMKTELGKIAGLVESIKEEKTPLQKAMKQLSTWLVFVALFFSIIIPVIGIFQGKNLFEMILTGLSLSFATIPEELPIIITVVLALGAYLLSKNNALVKYLRTAETLGSVTVIATDKTGTLTENKMKLSEIYVDGDLIELKKKQIDSLPYELLEIGVLLNDVIPSEEDNKYRGDPMEIALIEAGKDNGINYSELSDKNELVTEFSFDNERMIMSQLFVEDGNYKLLAKGATEQILERSSKIRTSKGNEDLTNEIKEKILNIVNEMAKRGLRVIAFANRNINSKNVSQEEAEQNLIFVGLAGFIDPPREEVKDAISACQKAGIRVMMITGDYTETARAIGNQLGIDARKIVTGKEVENMSEEDLKGRVNYIHVFARTTPEQKLRIVKALKENGEQVAVTGDGINDTPALKKADIGVSMGQTGTDVARETADMVLLDDNFTTIELAVEQGRKLYDNLKKGVRYYLAVKMALIVIFLLPIIFGIQLPFAPIQIILLELFMDLAASVTFVVEPSETNVMERPPRDPNEKFMNLNMNLGIILGGLCLIASVLIIYFGAIALGMSASISRTLAFGTWMVTHVFLAMNYRTEKDSLYKVGLLSNKSTIIWAIAAIATMFIIVYVPGLQNAFRVSPLNFLHWLIIFGISFLTTFWIEGVKILREKKFV
jgi:Ca2+-transporting ATPase